MEAAMAAPPGWEGGYGSGCKWESGGGETPADRAVALSRAQTTQAGLGGPKASLPSPLTTWVMLGRSLSHISPT